MGAAVLTGSTIGQGAGKSDPLAAMRLPPLRDDLELLPAPAAADGSPCWTIHDPVRNRFYRIGHAAFEAIARWHLGSPRAIARSIAGETLLEPEAEEIFQLFQFLAANNLTLTTDGDFLLRQAAARRVSWWMWLLHNYLFFRIPLVRPDRFLTRTLRWVAPFHGPVWHWTVLLAGLAGGAMVVRQWDVFVHTFLHFFTLEGMALYGVTLLATKTLHELGHAYTAKRHGCRVPTMGVAFLVLWPVLYTDTSDAWRLVSRRARLEIAAAGMLTELSLAALATLAWSFLPDGPLRSAAYFLATVSWITTLSINLSPFMRFDGYYLLADSLDVPNLQDRAFALARWRIREWLFGFGEPVPEELPGWLHRTLLVYAFFTWVYRLVLFIGIAVMVYHMFVKVLGILLFVVEIGWFILRPLMSEMTAWWKRRGQVRINLNLLATLAGLGGVVWLVTMPVTGSVAVPAVWRAEGFTTLFSPVPARVGEVLVRSGQSVAAGEVLFRLTAPELDSRLTLVELRIRLAQGQLDRFVAIREGLDRIRVMEEELAAALAERQGLLESRARLEVRSPIAGTVVDMADGLRPGRWISPRLPLAMVVAPGRSLLVGYIGEADLERVRVGARAVFHADDPLAPRLDAVVAAVDRVATASLDIPALASTYGGPVAVQEQTAGGGRQPGAGLGGLTPVEAAYRVFLKPADPSAAVPGHVERGVARVEGEARSLGERFWLTALTVLIRETAF